MLNRRSFLGWLTAACCWPLTKLWPQVGKEYAIAGDRDGQAILVRLTGYTTDGNHSWQQVAFNGESFKETNRYGADAYELNGQIVKIGKIVWLKPVVFPDSIAYFFFASPV